MAFRIFLQKKNLRFLIHKKIQAVISYGTLLSAEICGYQNRVLKFIAMTFKILSTYKAEYHVNIRNIIRFNILHVQH